MKQTRALTEGSISRGLFQFAVPILCSNVLQALNSSVNSIWVGRYLGEAGLTAVSNAQSLMVLLTGIALGISTAATILVGQHMGAGRMIDAKRTVGTSTTFFAFISMSMAAIGLMISEPLLVLMSVPADSLPLAVAYTRVIFLALPTIYMYAFLMWILFSSGDSKTPLCFMLLSVAISAGLNPIFIFGLGPLPRMGIAGSALATFVAQAVSLTALVAHLYRRRYPLCLHKEDLAMLRVDMAIVRTLVRKGIPIGMQVLVVSLSSVLMIVLVNRFGVDTTAAYGASLQLWNYLQMPAVTLGMAVASMAALNIGQQQWARVRSIARVGVVYCILSTGFTVLTLYAFDTHLFRLFLPSGSPALAIARHINVIAAFSFVLLGISVVLFGVVRAAGAVIAPLVIQILSLLVVRFPLAAALIDRWAADGIWWSFPVSSGLSVALAALYFGYGNWRPRGLQNSPSAQLLHTHSTEP
jgi:putative MATE family efflux protein